LRSSKKTCAISILWLFLCSIGSISAQTIRIAIILPLSNGYAIEGEVLRAAYNLACKRVDWGGIDAQPLFFDHQSQPETAESLAVRLAEDTNILAIASGYPSLCAGRIADIAEQYEIPYLIEAASADSLTQVPRRWVFRLCPASSDYNDGLLGWAMTVVGVERKIAVLYSADASRLEGVNDLQQDFKSYWTGVVEWLAFPAGARSFSSYIERLKQMRPAVVWIFSGTTDAAEILRTARENDYIPYAFILGSTSLADRRLIAIAQGDAEWTLAPAVWTPSRLSEQRRRFVKYYESQTGRPPDYRAAESYAAVEVLADAVRRCRLYSRPEFRQTLEETKLSSVFGPVQFENVRGFYNQNRLRTVVVQLRGGYWSPVWPLEQAETDAVYPVPNWRERTKLELRDRRRENVNLALIIITFLLLILVILRRHDIQKRKENP